MGRTFASLRHFNYRTWFFTALIANIGTWMQIVAQDWLVLAELTEDDAFAVGFVSALQFAPLLFITPFAGLLADRCDKRRILFVTQRASPSWRWASACSSCPAERRCGRSASSPSARERSRPSTGLLAWSSSPSSSPPRTCPTPSG